MADCLQSKYTYKGKEYTLETLAKHLAEGELANLAGEGVVDLNKYKKGKRTTFSKNLKGVTTKEAPAPKVETKVEPTVETKKISKAEEDLNTLLEAADKLSVNAVVLRMGNNGELMPASTIYKGKVVEGMANKAGEVSWDVDSLNRFSKALNKSFEGTSDKKIKFVVADAKGIEAIHEGLYGKPFPKDGESFLDKGKGIVFINGDVATLTTPMHEAAHLWLPHVKEYSPKLYEAGIEIISQNETYLDIMGHIEKASKVYDEAYKLGKDRGQTDADAKRIAELKREKYLNGMPKEAKQWRDYIERGSEIPAEERKEFVADEVLARAVEEKSEIKFNSRERETFDNWLYKTVSKLATKLGFKVKNLDAVKKLKLGDLANSIREEIVSPSKFSQIEKTANELRQEKLEKDKNKKAKLETQGLSEEGVAERSDYNKKKNEEILQKMKSQITDTDAVEKLRNRFGDLYDEAIQEIVDSGLVKKRIIELNKTPEGRQTLENYKKQQAALVSDEAYGGKVITAEQNIADNILADILSGKEPLPKTMGSLKGKGETGSGMISNIYNALAEAYGIHGSEVRNNLISAFEQAPVEKPVSPTREENKAQAKLMAIQKEIEKAYKMPPSKERTQLIEKLGADYMKAQNAIDDFDILHQTSGREILDDNTELNIVDEDGNRVYKIGRAKVDEPVKIEKTQDEIRKSGWFKWHFWSKNAILGKENVQALAKMTGRVSAYKKENLALANQLIKQSQKYLKEYNQRNPNNKFTGETFSNYLEDALRGNNEKLQTLPGDLKSTILTMRSNIDALSLAFMETGNLSYADMDTYYENLGTYVASVYDKWSTKEPTSLSYKISKYVKGKIEKSDSPIAGLLKKKFDLSTAPEWIKNLSKENIEAGMSGISDMVDAGYFDTEEMIKNGTAFRTEFKKLNKMQDDMSKAEKVLLDHELEKPDDVKSKEYATWNDTKNKLSDDYSKLEDVYLKSLDKYNARKKNQAEYQYGEIVKRAEDKGAIESVTNKMNWKKFSERKDIPEWYKTLIGESRDVFKNYFLTIGKMQNGHSIMMMQDEILNLGLQNGMIEEQGGLITPANKNYVIVGGQHSVTGTAKSQYGPLYGYKMHPDLYKFMYELPLMDIDNIGWKSFKGSFLESANFVNRLKIIYNPSSIIRNFASHFGNDLKLAGFYMESMALTNRLVKGNDNLFHLGMDHYKGGMKEYYKGLVNDGSKYGATTTISEQEFNRLFKDITSEKGLSEAFEKSKEFDANAPISSMVNSTFKMFKYVPKALRKAFFLGDFLPKLTHFEVMRNSIAYKAYGQNFYKLDAKQMDNCNNAASRCVTQDMATPELAGEMANIKYLGIVPKFTYEMARTRYESMKNALGKGILENYQDIDWHGDKVKNDQTIASLSRGHRVRKTIGLAHYSMTLNTALILGKTIFDKGKKMMEDEKQGIMVVGDPETKESNIVDEMLREAFTFGDNITNQQAVRNVIEPYMRTHNVYAEYDPETYTMKYWDAGRNDMYAQLNGVFRGFMYNLSPDESGIPVVSNATRSMASNAPKTSRGIATLSNQLSTYYGYNMMTKAMLDPLFDEKKNERTFGQSTSISENMVNYAKAAAQGIVPNDINRLTNTLEAAYHADGDFTTNTKQGLTKFFDDTYIKGLQGTYKEMNVLSIIRGKVKAEAKNMQEDIVYSRKKLTDAINRYSAANYEGKPFYQLSEPQKYELMNKPAIKEELTKLENVINEKARLSAKNMKTWYITAQKFNFKDSDMNKIFNDPEVINIDLGDFKSMPTYLNQDRTETFRNVLEKPTKDIENLDFRNLYNDKTYYINR
jgi:hypothetical protein